MMRCFRAKLSDRRERSAMTSLGGCSAEGGSPRHYCQRRMADSSCDEEEWLKRYHLDTPRLDRNDNVSRPLTPLAARELSEMHETSTTKNVFRPAFLTITNLDLPHSVLPTSVDNTWAKKRAKFKTVPKNCSSHLHRMFVKNRDHEDSSRASSRASTEYDGLQFEEYLRELNLPDDSSECSLFEPAEELDFSRFKNEDYDYEASNNNDVKFMNKNSDVFNDDKAERSAISKVHKKSKQKESVKTTSPSTSRERKTIDLNLVPILNFGGRKREKRKSITLSRLPSPETVQVIRIDVITGYPVENESVLSDGTDFERSYSDDNISIASSHKSTYCLQDKMHSGDSHADSKNSWKNISNESARFKANDTHEELCLLNCKTLNLSSRSLNSSNKSH